jgi:hypothetical protein
VFFDLPKGYRSAFRAELLAWQRLFNMDFPVAEELTVDTNKQESR